MTTTGSPAMGGGKPPSWLPAPASFGGDWTALIRALYAVFTRDFKGTWPRFRNRPVWHNRYIDPDDADGYEEGFWHLVTRDEWVWNPKARQNEKTRLPDIERAQKLPWARPSVEHEADFYLTVWDFDETTKKGLTVRTYLWLKSCDYVVVLEKKPATKGDIFMLITTFLVDIPSKRHDLESRYARRRK